MILTEAQSKQILFTVLGHVKAPEAEAHLNGSVRGAMRFARNVPTLSSVSDGAELTITCAIGKRIGKYATTDLTESSLRNAVRLAEAAAEISPENPERMPALAAQQYATVDGWDPHVIETTATDRVQYAAMAIEEARKSGLTSSGHFEHSGNTSAIANTKGLFGFERFTKASFSATMRTADGKGSGWAAAESFTLAGVSGAAVTHDAVRTAVTSMQPTELEPGAYVAVLAPSVVADLVLSFTMQLDRRAADEGRSYFSTPGHRIGDQPFAPSVTIRSDPTDHILPSSKWGEDGLPLGPVTWIDKGRINNLAATRYWGDRKAIQPLAAPSNVLMDGGSASLDNLIASTERGLYIGTVWYIREIDPKTMTSTGLTRDGLFLIERGKITRPVVNFRWNESPAALLKCIEMMTAPQLTVAREWQMPAVVPAIKVREFHCASVSPST